MEDYNHKTVISILDKSMQRVHVYHAWIYDMHECIDIYFK